MADTVIQFPYSVDFSSGFVTWPVPEDEEPRRDYYHYQPDPLRWRMRDEQGRVLFWIYRVYGKRKKGKIPHPHLHFTWCKFENGSFGWLQKTFPKPVIGYPLYNLDLIIKRHDRVIHIAEGEPKMDALTTLFPDDVATTTIGGCSRWSDTDWSYIAGRTIVLYRDLDEPGREYVTHIAKKALSLGCTVYTLDIEAFAAETPRGDPFAGRLMPGAETWDIANAIRDWGVVGHSDRLVDSTSRDTAGCDFDPAARDALVAALKRHTALYSQPSQQETSHYHNVRIDPTTYNEWHEARIRGALAHVSPSSRGVRVRIMRAIWSLGWGEIGWLIFCEWASGYEQFNESKAMDHWVEIVAQYRADLEALRNDASENVPARVGIGSLYYHAEQNGWRDNGREILRAMNRRFAFVHSRPDGIVDRYGKPDQSIRMLDKKSFANTFSAILITDEIEGDETKSKPVTADKFWMAWRSRTEFVDAGWWPIGKELPRHLNLFNGLAVKGDWQGEKGSACDGYPTIKEFLLNTICSGNIEWYSYLLRLLQWKIQNPTTRPEVTIVLIGMQGVGKGMFVKILSSIFGRKYFIYVGNPKDATSDFNANLEGRLIEHFDEAFFGYSKAAEGWLKSHTTEPFQSINPKNINRYEVPNLSLKVITSNHDVPVPLDIDDRRDFVLDIPPTRKAYVDADFGYWRDINTAIGTGKVEEGNFVPGAELEAFVADALEADLSGFNRRLIPKTPALHNIAEATADTKIEYLHLLLRKGDLLSTGNERVGTLRQDGGCAIPELKKGRGWEVGIIDIWRVGSIAVFDDDLFHKDYVAWLKVSHPKKTPDRKSLLYRKIQEILGEGNFTSKQIRYQGGEPRMRCVVELDICRMKYQNLIKRPNYNWDTGEDDPEPNIINLQAGSEED